MTSRAFTRMKSALPLRVRMRARRMLDWRPPRPRDLASASASPSNVLHHRFRVAYRRREFRRFFADILSPGELVFDVGANVGEWTDAFRAIGCRVVAVEPQADCAALIRGRYSRDPDVTVVEAAVTDRPGTQELILTSTGSEHASLSREFIDSIIGGGSPAPTLVVGTVAVESLTLAQLYDRFGVPGYIKLDIEGLEEAALATARPLPDLLSFEFHREWLEAARAILERLRPEGYVCNVTYGEWLWFEWTDWRPPSEALGALEGLPRDAWGNVFARSAIRAS